MRSRTLTDLPPELLHLILADFDKLWYYKVTLWSCSLTCRLLRAVALEHLNFRRLSLKEVTSLDPLLAFLRLYPRVAKTVISLSLWGPLAHPDSDSRPLTTIDDTLVASVVELLPKLDSLHLQSFKYSMPQSPRAAGPFPLSTFTLRGHGHVQSSLACTLRVLSLFTPKHVQDFNLSQFDLNTPFEPDALHRPADVQRLWLLGSMGGGPRYTSRLLQALAVSLKSDSLQELSVKVDSKETVHALGELLSRTGCNLTTLEIRNGGAMLYPRERTTWIDPLEGNWELLDLSTCRKLESITLPMHFRESRTRPLSNPIVGILQRASQTTLRKVHIRIYGLPKPTNIGNRTVFRIHDLDRCLSATHFPQLQVCELNIRCDFSNAGWPRCQNSARRALKDLHGRGLLKVTRD